MEQAWKAVSVGLLIISIVSACVTRMENNAAPSALPGPTIMPTAATPDMPFASPIEIYTTQNNLLGNHLIDGRTDLATASIMDISLNGEPLWLVSAPLGDSVLFVAVLQDGQIQAFKIREQTRAAGNFASTTSRRYATAPSDL